MSFTFRFTSTHDDLLDGFDAYRTARTGMRHWARMLVVALGFLALAGFVMVLVTGQRPHKTWQPFVWLVLGLFLLWHFLVKPSIMKRRLRSTTASSQEVSVSFTDSGLDILVSGMGHFHRSWDELSQVIQQPKGIAMAFDDGTAHWLPNRVFENTQQQAAFNAFLISKFQNSPGGH
jgi:hypothetical protein